ncbi:CYTH domain-containing protein [Streptococcus equinus]|uniref:CYTH domain-containing protein n=1 Tax=Streptococcus equinus TaxID=1335 RepID=UPI00215B5CF5|nr:CYTH domain-containing protein [Streptococcus equinus]UVF03495.1 CYTH domain-containing protein [Streptococcus equinus]
MTHLEIEYKTLLTKDEFNRLNSQLSHVTPVTQTNYYFDSDNFDMKAHRMSLRIRTLPNRAEITLKIPKEVGNLEYNYDLSVADAKEIIKSGQFPEVDFLKLIEENGVKLSSLKNFGSLTTTRRETMTDIGLMALDSNQYADIKDYELELEVENAEKGKKDFDNFLAQHDIDFKYAKSKVARFSATLKRI